jgi:hypothetical protein
MRLAFLAAIALAAAAPGSATILFSDDFEAEGPPNTLNYTGFANWTVTGQVDLVGMPNGFGITCDGNCVDLDGSPGPGQIASTAIAFAAGVPVRIAFDLSGSQRSSADDLFFFDVEFADATDLGGGEFFLPILGAGSLSPTNDVTAFSIAELIPGSLPFATYFIEFLPLESGSLVLEFGTSSGDNVGPVLDNVLVTQVPEAATWAMLVAGFGLVGAAVRRKSARGAAIGG